MKVEVNQQSFCCRRLARSNWFHQGLRSPTLSTLNFYAKPLKITLQQIMHTGGGDQLSLQITLISRLTEFVR